MSTDLDANDLLLFARIIEAGSLTRAAERTGLPKSTLSRRLTLLETRLGERLLTRTTRRLVITEFGERMLDHARRLQEEVEAVSALVLHRQLTPRGTLRVSLPPDFHELDLVPFLMHFAASYPEVRVELDISPRRVDLIAERFDLALRIASQLPDDNMLVARRLTELHFGLHASPAYLARHGVPAEPADLMSHVSLRLMTGNGELQPWRLSRGTERWEGAPDCPLAANSIGLQRTLAMQGMGIVALSSRAAAPLLEQGVLQRVLPDWQLPTVTVWCVTPGRRLLPARTAGFIEHLRVALDEGAGSPGLSADPIPGAILAGLRPPA